MLPVSQVVRRPEDKSKASGYEYRRSWFTVGQEQQERPIERSDTSRQGEHPAQHLGKRDLPMHVFTR